MRKFIAFLALLFVLLPSAAHLFAQDRPNLIEVLENDADGRFTTLLSAIDAAGMRDELSGGGPYTLLAPTNDAFTEALGSMGMTADDLLADKQLVSQIVLYHVVRGQNMYRNVSGGATLPTLLLGQSVTFARDNGRLLVNGVFISDANLLGSNGVVHAIDGVLLPPAVAAAMATPEPTSAPTEAPTPEPTPEVAAGVPAERPSILALLENDPDGRFTTFLSALDAAPLVRSLLEGAGPFTVLAPTNDAFDAALQTMGMTADDLFANKQLVGEVVLYHIVHGQNLYRSLSGGATLSTYLPGGKVTFARDGGRLLANGAFISDANLLASNGVVHAIDDVLLPPDVQAAMATPEPTAEPTEAPTPEPTPEVVAGVPFQRLDLVGVLENDADARFTTLVSAIDAAGLRDELSGNGPFTLLAPSNDAFDATLQTLGMTVDQLLADRKLVSQIVLYHVIRGQNMYRNLSGGATLPTLLLGQSVTFARDSGRLLVNGVFISDANVLASNGVVHAIDGVLLPPDIQAMVATPEPTAAPTEAPTPEPTPEVAAGVPAERPNLVALLENDPDGRFTTLVSLIDAAGQRDTLSTGGPFTLLAPTNDAFSALLDQLGMTPEQAIANPNLITPMLLYHVIPGRYLYRNLSGGAELPTLLTDQKVTFSRDGGRLLANGVFISDANLLASNGVVHALDGVLLPPAIQAALATPEPTPEPTAAPTEQPTQVAGTAAERPSVLALLENDPDARFTTFLSALDAAPSVKYLLGGDGPFTLLAPTNDAFDALFTQTNLTADALFADRGLVSKIILYQTIRGRNLYRSLSGGVTLDTALSGQTVTFARDGGRLLVNGVFISDANLLASNGVVHAIDDVLLPPDVQTTLMSNPRMRVANFSPDAGAVDVYVNGALSSMTGINFPDVSAWMNVNVGTYEIGIAPAGGDPVVTISVDAAEGQWVLVAVTGSMAQGTLAANVALEDYSPLADGNARLSMFNGVEGSPAYNVTVDGRAVVIRLGYPGTIGNNDGYYSADVAAGTYTIRFVVYNQTSNVVIDLPDVTLEAGNSYLLAAAGSSGAPGAVIVPSVVPAQ